MKLKNQLYEMCVKSVAKKASEIKQIIDDAVEAANGETKSSAGDKYETGIEMMQQEIELNVARLAELGRQRETLDRISPDIDLVTAQPGALVKTNNGYYYLAIAIGQLKLDGTTYYAISTSSPVGELMHGKKKGDTFSLNGKNFVIEHVL